MVPNPIRPAEARITNNKLMEPHKNLRHPEALHTRPDNRRRKPVINSGIIVRIDTALRHPPQQLFFGTVEFFNENPENHRDDRRRKTTVGPKTPMGPRTLEASSLRVLAANRLVLATVFQGQRTLSAAV